MSIDFQDITIIANPEQAQVRDGSRRHSKKYATVSGLRERIPSGVRMRPGIFIGRR